MFGIFHEFSGQFLAKNVCWNADKIEYFFKFDAKKTSFFQSFQLIFDHFYFVRALAENNYKNKIENISLVAKKKSFLGTFGS